MVENQLRRRGIKDPRTLSAMLKVPRHHFVPHSLQSSAYDDCALPIGSGQTISQPYMVAIMTELLGLKGKEKVLEIGTGSGYQTAVLSLLCKKVYSIDRLDMLSVLAKKDLDSLGYSNVELLVKDGTEGLPEEAPFECILVTAACPEVPDPLLEQLSEGGRLVIPVGDRFSQVLTLIKKENGVLRTEPSIGCIFVPLIGKYGWKP